MQMLGLISSLFGDNGAQIQGAIMDGYRTFVYSLCTTVYKLIIFCYDIFDRISTARILDNSVIDSIFSRVGLILGVFMLFRLLFSFIQMLVNPETIADKEKGLGSIIKKVIIVVVLLGSTSFIFKEAYEVQNIVMGKSDINDKNLIALILRPSGNIETSGNFGSSLSYYLLSSFYKINELTEDSQIPTSSDDDEIDYVACQQYMQDNVEDGEMSIFHREVSMLNTFDTGYNCLNATMNSATTNKAGKSEKYYIMEFDGLLALLVGVITLWMLVSYCISAGIRIIQLAFLQMIAPIPIMSYMSPKKDGMFQKWTKQCITTYIDLFIRVAIINLVVYLIVAIMDANTVTGVFKDDTFYNAASSTTQTFLTVAIILALLAFAKRAPKLVGELFPSSGAASIGYGLSLKDKGGNILGKATSALLGAGAGGIAGLVTGGGAIGFLGGAGKGLTGGLKGKGDIGSIGKNALTTAQGALKAGAGMRKALNQGGNRTDYRIAQLQSKLGMKTNADRDSISENQLKRFTSYRDSIRSVADGNSTVSGLKRTYENLQSSGASVAAIQAAYTNYQHARDGVINAAMRGQSSWSYVDNNNVAQNGANIDTQDVTSIQTITRAANSSLPTGVGPITNSNTLSNAHNTANAQLIQLTNSSSYMANKANSGK